MRVKFTTNLEETMIRAIRIMAFDLKCDGNDIIEALFSMHSQEEIKELVAKYKGNKKEL